MTTIIGVSESDGQVDAFNLDTSEGRARLYTYFKTRDDFRYESGFWYFQDSEFRRVEFETETDRWGYDDMASVFVKVRVNGELLHEFTYTVDGRA